MMTRQPSPPAANGRRFGTMSPRRTRYVTRNQGVFRNRKNRFHTWTESFSGLTERCDATFLINSCLPFFTRTGRKRGPASAGSYTRKDRKSTRLNSSHGYISYAVFCLKKKKNNKKHIYNTRTQ